MKVKIKGPFIKLSQFLKKIKIIDSGGQTKDYISKHHITINGEAPKGRGSKIHIGDVVWIDDLVYSVISEEE